MREAAWPAIRSDLGLSYTDIGVLLALPSLVADLLEPFLALLAGSRRRRAVIAVGGIAFGVALLVVAGASGFVLLLAGFLILYPASGAFVSLSQATLMDLQPERRERNMARWVLAGSLGLVAGPIVLAVCWRFGWGWRPVFLVLAVASMPLAVCSRFSAHASGAEDPGFRHAVAAAMAAVRRGRVLRWLVLVHVADLMGDVLAGFLAVYFVDVAHVSVAEAALAVVIWTVAGLIGDALLVVVLTRVSGLAHLRVTAVAATAAFPALLLAPGVGAKLALLAVLGVLHAGWYAIPQGRLYDELHENSSVALALSNVAGLAAGALPLLIGILAEGIGLGGALWVCLVAPVALLAGTPRERAPDVTRRPSVPAAGPADRRSAASGPAAGPRGD